MEFLGDGGELAVQIILRDAERFSRAMDRRSIRFKLCERLIGRRHSRIGVIALYLSKSKAIAQGSKIASSATSE